MIRLQLWSYKKRCCNGCQNMLRWKNLILPLSFQHNLGEEVQLVDEKVEAWWGRSAYYGRDVCHTPQFRSVLIIYHRL